MFVVSDRVPGFHEGCWINDWRPFHCMHHHHHHLRLFLEICFHMLGALTSPMNTHVSPAGTPVIYLPKGLLKELIDRKIVSPFLTVMMNKVSQIMIFSIKRFPEKQIWTFCKIAAHSWMCVYWYHEHLMYGTSQLRISSQWLIEWVWTSESFSGQSSHHVTT